MEFGDLSLGFYCLLLKSCSDFVYLKHTFRIVKQSVLNHKKDELYYAFLFPFLGSYFVSLYEIFCDALPYVLTHLGY